MVSEQVAPAVTVDEHLLHPPVLTNAVSLPHGLGADVGLMLTEIVQGRRDKRDVRQLEDIDVRHPITAHAQMGRRPTHTFEDFTSPEHSTGVGDRVVPEQVVLAFIMARVDVVLAPV